MTKPDLYIVARMLEKIYRADGPMLRTRLQVASKVNYNVFIRYLDWMQEKELVTLRALPDGHEGIELTEKGKESYKRLVNWINEIVHDKFIGE
jgi:predicted transcriptional regulator